MLGVILFQLGVYFFPNFILGVMVSPQVYPGGSVSPQLYVGGYSFSVRGLLLSQLYVEGYGSSGGLISRVFIPGVY